MVKFKDCKTKKDKFKYILACVITVLVTVIIVFSVFFTSVYFIGGSCSKKASAAEISTETSLTITLPTLTFQLNSLSPSSPFEVTRYVSATLNMTPSYSTLDFYNTFRSSPDMDFYANEWNFIRAIHGSINNTSYLNFISFSEQEIGYFVFRNIDEFYPVDDRSGNYLELYPDLNLSSVHLLNWSRSYYNHSEFSDNFLNEYYYIDDGVEHTVDIDIFDSFDGLEIISYDAFQYSYTNTLGVTSSFFLEFYLPVYGISSSIIDDGDFNFSLDTYYTADNSEEAFNNGYQQGINVANAKEYEKGYEEGAEFGYTQGYYDGVDEQLSNITPFGVIRHGLTDLFSIQLFPGFQLSTLFYIVVGVVLLGIIIKVFYHG